MSTNAPPSSMVHSDRVIGTPVYGTSGEKLGSVADLAIDKRSGRVQFVVVESGGVLGLGARRYRIAWDELAYDTARDGYRLPFTQADLEDAPRAAAVEPEHVEFTESTLG